MIDREPEEHPVLFSLQTKEGVQAARQVREYLAESKEATSPQRARRLAAQVFIMDLILTDPVTGITDKQIELTLRGYLGNRNECKTDIERSLSALCAILPSIVLIDNNHS